MKTKEFNHAVLAACETMQGIWQPEVRMTNGIVLAFLKSLSDKHKRQRALLRQKFGDDEQIKAALARASFVVPVDCTACVRQWPAHRPSLGHVACANPARLDGVFLHVAFAVSEHSAFAYCYHVASAIVAILEKL